MVEAPPGDRPANPHAVHGGLGHQVGQFVSAAEDEEPPGDQPLVVVEGAVLRSVAIFTKLGLPPSDSDHRRHLRRHLNPADILYL
jgi:hypothetical protein